MKFYIAQDTDGEIWLFTEKPKQFTLTYPFKGKKWAIEQGKGTALCITDSYNSKAYIDKETNGVKHLLLADIMGFKRMPPRQDGTIRYKGITMNEAKEVEITFDIKIIKPKF